MVRTILKTGLLICLIWCHEVSALKADTQQDHAPMMRDRVWNYLVDGASISVGTGARAISLDVQRLGTNDKGKLIDGDGDAFFLSYNLKANFFGDSNFGYNWMFNISSFELQYQEVAPNVIRDMDSHVQGNFAYAVPAFFYNIGNRYNGSHFRFGLGLGLGIAEFQGDIVLTESAQANDRADISNGPSNLFVAGGLFIDAQMGYLTLRIATAGPSLEYNGYKISIADTSVMLGVTIPIHD